MNNLYMFHEKSACKICKCLVFPKQEIDFIKIRSFESLFFIENSIQNHARKVDVRSIEKSIKNDAKMDPKSFQYR